FLADPRPCSQTPSQAHGVLDARRDRRALRDLAVYGAARAGTRMEPVRALSARAALPVQRRRGGPAAALRLVRADRLPPGLLFRLAHPVRRLCGPLFRALTNFT